MGRTYFESIHFKHEDLEGLLLSQESINSFICKIYPVFCCNAEFDKKMEVSYSVFLSLGINVHDIIISLVLLKRYLRSISIVIKLCCIYNSFN